MNSNKQMNFQCHIIVKTFSLTEIRKILIGQAILEQKPTKNT